VRQGQIGEIIAAKPQQRRRILEDAAGIAGLHSRRHEAELRLKGTEDNLLRLEYVLAHIETQMQSLDRQAKQAVRYRAISAAIRKAEALSLYLTLTEAKLALEQAERQLDLDTRAVADATIVQGQTARDLAVAEHTIEPLRLAEAERGAALQRLRLARESIEAEEKRVRERGAELERRLAELARDAERETLLAQDAARALAALEEEARAIKAATANGEAAHGEAETQLMALEARLAAAEAGLNDSQGALAELNARRDAAERQVRAAAGRLANAESQRQAAEQQLNAAMAAASGGVDVEALRAQAAAAQQGVEAAEAHAVACEAALAAARESEARQRVPLQETERTSQRLETEVRTLKKLLESGTSDLWPPVLDQLSVTKGYEVALGAALGDDLEASTATTAPVHWLEVPRADDPPLPADIEPLSRYVTAPAALARRLSQIGIVTRGDGPRLRTLLRPGQRLVSTQGDLWRWDGLTAAAEAPSPAVRRLAEKNRLGDLEIRANEARTALEALRKSAEAQQAKLRDAAREDTAAREAARMARQKRDAARESLAQAERKSAESAARLAALTEARTRLALSAEEALAEKAKAETTLAAFQPDAELRVLVGERQAVVAGARAEAATARAAFQGLRREAELRAQRLTTVERETAAWVERQARAGEQRNAITGRADAARAERATLEEAPATLAEKRRALTHEIGLAEQAARDAADTRALAETGRLAADKAAKAALAALSDTREARARTEAKLDATRTRLEDAGRTAMETLETTLAELPRLAGIENINAPLPDLRTVEEKVSGLRRERERMGGVNLQADDELAEITAKRDGLVGERADLTEAIGKLRRAIHSLNEEGRERLLAAFDIVNSEFQRLFSLLFGGGTAELQLIESPDPLEAGLEILAKPPGKKPQVLTLLSGGEQALTATALIFAVFLTNPSPICVLDEIDAPLDDANVERLCNLLDEMVATTTTRFIVITHNPITMARMDRLFGVTMAERGISRLVSVDLREAATFAEAG
jgi:chromosome segregation protein